MLPILALLGPVIERIASLIPDPAARARAIADAQTQALAALSTSDLGQTSTNAVEAANPSVFVAGARPAFMWLCVFLVGWSLAVRDIVVSFVTIWSPHFSLPSVPTDELWTLTFGMLGLGALRSFEKVKGVQTVTVGGR